MIPSAGFVVQLAIVVQAKVAKKKKLLEIKIDLESLIIATSL
jgi:hypothetical protein